MGGRAAGQAGRQDSRFSPPPPLLGGRAIAWCCCVHATPPPPHLPLPPPLPQVGLAPQQLRRLLLSDPGCLACALPNLQRKERFLTCVMGLAASDVVERCPAFFSASLLHTTAPRCGPAGAQLAAAPAATRLAAAPPAVASLRRALRLHHLLLLRCLRRHGPILYNTFDRR